MKIYNELQLAKELIKFPSITPVDAGTMNFLARKLRSLGFKCKILEFKSKNSKLVKNLYARLGKSRPNFCYAGHTDVVPPGNLNDWTVNPFKPEIKENYLIGRGANDMKASVACFISAVSKFKRKKFKGSISLLITGDEFNPYDYKGVEAAAKTALENEGKREHGDKNHAAISKLVSTHLENIVTAAGAAAEGAVESVGHSMRFLYLSCKACHKVYRTEMRLRP